jgi:hypothetical protein
MNILTTSEKKRCVLCGRVTHENILYTRSGIEIIIPVCDNHRKDASFNLEGGLKHITDTIRHTVVLSSICGYDEKKISEFQRKARTRNELA